jgi:hypothetical protein
MEKTGRGLFEGAFTFLAWTERGKLGTIIFRIVDNTAEVITEYLPNVSVTVPLH